MNRRSWSKLLVTLGVSLIPCFARASDPVAETLFQEGRKAAQAKDWARACTKFKESQDREPAPGTLLNLADCEENRDMLLEAFLHFDAASRLFYAGDSRAAYAAGRAVAVQNRIPKLTLHLDANSPQGTRVERDGSPLDPAAIGTATLINPGDHTIVVHAPGRSEVKKTIRLSEGETREMDLASGSLITSDESHEPEPNAQSAPGRGVPPPLPSRSPFPYRTAGFVSLGVGALGIALGLVGGLFTLNAKGDIDNHCGPRGCDGKGLSAESTGKTWSTVGTIGFITGGAALATGAGVLLLAPKHDTKMGVVAHPVSGGAQLSWVGRFQ